MQTSFARNSAAEKRGRAKIPSPQAPSFLLARAEIFFKIQRSDFRGKKFGFCSRCPASTIKRADSAFYCGWFLRLWGLSIFELRNAAKLNTERGKGFAPSADAEGANP